MKIRITSIHNTWNSTGTLWVLRKIFVKENRSERGQEGGKEEEREGGRKGGREEGRKEGREVGRKGGKGKEGISNYIES
jgi:hypothetical protein